MSKKNSNLIYLIMIFVMVLFMSVAARMMRLPDMITQVTTILGSFAVGYLVFLFTYDLGKYLIGKISGFKFISYRVLTSIRAKNEEGKVKGYYHKSLFKFAELIMYKDNNQTRKSAMTYLLGGTIFNGIIALGLVLTGFIMQDGDNIRSILFILAITDLFLIAQNIIPINSGTSNDGSYLKVVKESDESLRLFYTNLEYMNHICKDKPTDFDFNRFVINEEFNPDNPTHANAYSNTIKYYIYKHEFAKAAQLIKEKEEMNKLFVDDIMYDLKLKSIFLKTMQNNDEEALYDRDNLNVDSKDVSKAKNIDRAIENYAFYKFSNMDEYAAEEAYNQAVKLFDKSPYHGLIKEQKELLDFLKVYRFINKENR